MTKKNSAKLETLLFFKVNYQNIQFIKKGGLRSITVKRTKNGEIEIKERKERKED